MTAFAKAVCLSLGVVFLASVFTTSLIAQDKENAVPTSPSQPDDAANMMKMMAAMKGNKSNSDRPRVVAFQLQHADLEMTMNVISTLMADEPHFRAEIHAVNNSILAVATPDTIEKIRELIAELDKANVHNDSSELKVVFFYLKFAKAAAVAETVTDLMGEMSGKSWVSSDSKFNAIIVRANQADIDEIAQLIEKLDRSMDQPLAPAKSLAKNCVIKVTWLVEGESVDDDETKLLREPSKSLAQLVKGLQGNGTLKNAKALTELGTSTQVVTGIQQKSEFINSSQRSLGGTTQSLHIEGYVTGQPGSSYELKLSLDLTVGEHDLDVHTTISLPKNHPVAFSVSDIGNYRSVAVVEILDSF